MFIFSLPKVLEEIIEIIGGSSPSEYDLLSKGKPITDTTTPLQDLGPFDELTLKKKKKVGGIFRRTHITSTGNTTPSKTTFGFV